MAEDIDPQKVEAAREIERRLGYGATERPATEDDQVVGGLQMVLDQKLLRYGLPREAGLTGLLRHIELSRGFSEGIQAEHIRLLRKQVAAFENGIRQMKEEGEPYVTKTGKVLTDDDIEALSAEAEQGYDVQHLVAAKGAARHWECVKQLVLTSGALSAETQKELIRHGLRNIGPGQNGEQAYSYQCFVDTASAGDALVQSNQMLRYLLAPYGVEMMVYDSSARVVRAG